jgi:TPR repeat protein
MPNFKLERTGRAGPSAKRWADKPSHYLRRPQMRPSPRTLVGVLHREGWGVERDYAEAVKWFRAAAEQGHAKAQYNLGRMSGR